MTLTVTLPATVEPKLDRDLVQLCLAGRPDEFRHLVRRYERVVTAHLRLRLGYRRPSSRLPESGEASLVQDLRLTLGVVPGC